MVLLVWQVWLVMRGAVASRTIGCPTVAVVVGHPVLRLAVVEECPHSDRVSATTMRRAGCLLSLSACMQARQ